MTIRNIDIKEFEVFARKRVRERMRDRPVRSRVSAAINREYERGVKDAIKWLYMHCEKQKEDSLQNTVTWGDIKRIE